jgi:hypothetical protein
MTKLRISKRTPFNPNFIEETREMKEYFITYDVEHFHSPNKNDNTITHYSEIRSAVSETHAELDLMLEHNIPNSQISFFDITDMNTAMKDAETTH